MGAGAEGAEGVAISVGGRGGGVGPPEHPLPGYGAGYDAGFQAGLLAAAKGRVTPLGPAPVTEAQGGAGAGAPEPARPPLLALVEDFPEFFQKEVLERLNRVDLALLGRAGSAVRTAVKRSGLSRVGGSVEEPRVGIAPFCKYLSTFVWAVANGCPWRFAATSRDLAEGGHLEVLQSAREHGCPWDEWGCAHAAAGGHLEVLRWLREHHCPWHKWTCAMPHRAVTRRCCDGRGRTTARGMGRRVHAPRQAGTC